MYAHAQEVAAGKRFEFGKNWRRFLATLNEEKIRSAEDDLKQKLDCDRLDGLSFLDVGSGSGLSSLAARRLGARVHSFDYDPMSVACTQTLRDRFFPGDEDWSIEEGSALDVDYLRSLGKFDIVYSWGVLHHTGAMWQALENVTIPVAHKGRLFIAIYNQQRVWTKLHTLIKRSYNAAPRPAKWAILGAYGAYDGALKFVYDIAVGRSPLHRYFTPYNGRGMGQLHDLIDWVGGYPFETARPDELFRFFQQRSFLLQQLETTGRLGCNVFVFCRIPAELMQVVSFRMPAANILAARETISVSSGFLR